MPSPILHAATGYFLQRSFKNRLDGLGRRVWGLPAVLIVLAGLSLLPDIDFIPGLLTGDIGRFHNHLTHSLAAGVVTALAVASVLAKIFKAPWPAWFLACLLAYEMHVVMDVFTGERGVMLLWPFSLERISSPVKLFLGVKWGNGLFSIWHVWTILSEAATIAAVGLLFIIGESWKGKARAAK